MNQFKIRCSAIGQLMTEARSKSEPLSETAKEYIRQQWIADTYGRQKDFSSKAIQKGIANEEQGIRPYLNIYTPENILDWKYTRSSNGYYYLEYLKIRESIEDDGEYYKIWYLDKIDTVFLPTSNRDEPKLIESVPNPLGKIPAVILYNQRCPR